MNVRQLSQILNFRASGDCLQYVSGFAMTHVCYLIFFKPIKVHLIQWLYIRWLILN